MSKERECRRSLIATKDDQWAIAIELVNGRPKVSSRDKKALC
jgi:hypothetical protein